MASQIRRDLQSATVQTTDNTPTTLLSVPVPPNSSVFIWGMVVGRRSTTDTAAFAIYGTYRNAGGTVSLVGATVNAATNRDAPLVTAVVTFVISGTNVNVVVTGVGGFTIEWGGFITTLVGTP